jgi:hypothetical protein
MDVSLNLLLISPETEWGDGRIRAIDRIAQPNLKELDAVLLIRTLRFSSNKIQKEEVSKLVDLGLVDRLTTRTLCVPLYVYRASPAHKVAIIRQIPVTIKGIIVGCVVKREAQLCGPGYWKGMKSLLNGNLRNFVVWSNERVALARTRKPLVGFLAEPQGSDSTAVYGRVCSKGAGSGRF